MTLFALWDLHPYWRRDAKEKRTPLVHLSADEAVEVIEALQAGPAIEWPCNAGFPVSNVVVLADECCAVATLAQNFGEHTGAFGNLPAVSRISVADLGDYSRSC